MEYLSSFLGGASVALSLGSPVEWGIHRWLLHPKRRNMINRAAAHAHHDVHHGGYRGPAHYYRDISNENVTIHFSKGDVGLIAGIAGIFGSAFDGTYLALKQKTPCMDDTFFIGGFLTGTMLYYGAYELSHHYMHVIGKRRLSINKLLGDTLQDDQPDGKLRFSKPLLDDICDAVERHIDDYTAKDKPLIFPFKDEILLRLESQIANNKKKNIIKEHFLDSMNTLQQVTLNMLDSEENYRNSLSRKEKIKYWIERKVQKRLRASTIFQKLDNHHFLHHYKYLKNLNVVFPLMDYAMRTKLDNSRKFLDENEKYWLCPNSPEKKPFSLEKALIHSH